MVREPEAMQKNLLTRGWMWVAVGFRLLNRKRKNCYRVVQEQAGGGYSPRKISCGQGTLKGSGPPKKKLRKEEGQAT